MSIYPSSRAITKEKFIVKAKEKHPNYDYSGIEYVNYNTKIEFMCPIHGSYIQTPKAHLLQEYGCRKCADYAAVRHRTTKFRLKSLRENLDMLGKLYCGRYDYSLIPNTATRQSIVKIICDKHGEFEILLKSHLDGNHCSKCSDELRHLLLTTNNPYTWESSKQKSKETKTLKYGDPNFSNPKLGKTTCLEKYGVDHHWKSKEIRAKSTATILTKYGVNNVFKASEFMKVCWIQTLGVNHPMKNPIIFEKNQKYRTKSYALNTGETFTYQGYELKCILDLINIYGYKFSDLTLSNRRSFKYGDKVYHPDIIIQKEMRVIEVKSSYTYSVDYEKLGKVKPAVEMAGFTFECWIY